MANGLNKIVKDVEQAGARLVASRHGLGIDGTLPDELRHQVLMHRSELRRYLTWDQEVAYHTVCDAMHYLAKHYKLGAVNPQDGLLSQEIDAAFELQDMWMLRTSLRAWVVSWLAAISVHKEVSKV